MAVSAPQAGSVGTKSPLMRNNDVILAVGIALIVGMLVIPLPSILLDFFITINLTLGLLILLVSITVREPLEFSVFPPLLLFATLFRLAINVSSGRLILLNGQAGYVIAAFGNVVVGGNFVVGLVMFVVLVVIQFVVITNGAGRVAEVAARFTLDAMPGKQMAIDADMNAGVINDEEARRRRRKVQREADFYGAMDGASKFVKGDAIAGIVLIVVNLLGGLAVGVLQRHLPIDRALQSYALLTVGDGLVAQIPALLIATASGIIVTRSGSDAVLGDDLVQQLFAQPRVLAIAAAMIGLLGLAPGMPKLPFLFLGASLATGAYLLSSGRPSTATAPIVEARPTATDKETLNALLKVDPIELELGFGLVALADPGATGGANRALPSMVGTRAGDLLQRVSAVRRQIAQELGLVLPTIRVRDNLQLPPNTYAVRVRDVEVARGEARLDRFLALGPAQGLGAIAGIPTRDPAFGLPAVWIVPDDKQQAEVRGYTVIDPSSVIVTHLTEILRTHGPDLLTRQDIQGLLDIVKVDNAALVTELVPDLLTLGEIQRVLQNLLREHVPIRNLQTILETLGDHARQTRDPGQLTEFARQALGRTIVSGFLDDDGKLGILALAPRWQQVLSGAVQATDRGPVLALEPGVTQTFLQEVSRCIERLAGQGNPVLLVAGRLRIPVRRLAERQMPNLVVLAYEEIPAQIVVQTVGVVGG